MGCFFGCWGAGVLWHFVVAVLFDFLGWVCLVSSGFGWWLGLFNLGLVLLWGWHNIDFVWFGGLVAWL